MYQMEGTRSFKFVLKSIVFLTIFGFASGNNLRYHEYIINPLGNLQKKLEAQRAIQPFLNSKPFLEWTNQLSKQSLLKRANQVNLRKFNDTAPVTDSNPISTFLQNILGQLNNNTTRNNTSSSGIGDAFQNLVNGFLGSFSAGGDQAKASNGSQNGSPAGSFGNFLQNITQNTNGIGNLITSMLGASGGKGGATSGMNLGNILQLLNGGNVDPSTIGNILMSFLNGAVQGTNASTACQGDFIKVIKGLQNMEAWALKFLDASAKIPTDLLNLNLNWYGSYDECYSDSTFLESFGILHNTQTPVKGQYCNTNLNLPLPPEVKGILTVAFQNSGFIKAGICFPKSCSTDDLLQIVNAFLYNIPLGDNKVTAWPITCPVPAEEDTLETDTIVVVIILAIFLVIILEGTLYDVVITIRSKRNKENEKPTENGEVAENGKPIENGNSFPENSYKLRAENGNVQHIEPEKKHLQKPGIVGRLVLCFSAYTNGKKILGTSQPKGSLTAVNGIRFLSMSWVILGHTLAFVLGSTSNMLQYYNKFVNRAASEAIVNALFSVDTFFVLSGLLTSYLLLKQMKKSKGWINWGLFYFHRYWRLTPVYMIVIGMYVTIYPHLIFGPNKGKPDEICRESWWKNLLYIDNFFGYKDLCLGWSWYLNNDMQFYILSPLLIVPFFFNQIVGIIVSVCFLLAATITPGVLSYVKNLPVHTIGGGPKDADRAAYFEDYYIVPYCRMGPYICGVITGYILYKTKCKCRMNIFVNLLGWAVATAMACGCLYGLHNTLRPDNPVYLSKEVTALYNGVSRTAWGAAVCWVIFACSTGNGGIINTLLSWKAFVPLSRLTYCAYLVHPLVMYVYYFNWNFPLYMTDLDFVYIFLGNLMVSYGIAFIVSIAFESPFMGLEKIMFGGLGKKKK
uniref:Nose resistant-to-fluoxetine protein N-terminal domain-containing protein n=2 Tax=Magallana gigas TaxID=29159 RepID=A0A8W8L931_MAGGI|nr:nose resistant to fluoxetine protein 6 [Crassostrea gigas]